MNFFVQCSPFTSCYGKGRSTKSRIIGRSSCDSASSQQVDSSVATGKRSFPLQEVAYDVTLSSPLNNVLIVVLRKQRKKSLAEKGDGYTLFRSYVWQSKAFLNRLVLILPLQEVLVLVWNNREEEWTPQLMNLYLQIALEILSAP